MTETRMGKLRRSTDPPGYWLGEAFHVGFADNPLLSEGHRRRIATWAKAAGSASDAQRKLLAQLPQRKLSETQKRAEELAGPRASPMWQYLTEGEQGMVLDPSAHSRLADATYPLGIGQLATLTGSTQDQIRHWHELGLLRARRSKGGHRQFFANAALRAFFLRGNMPQPYITVLRDISNLKGAPLLAGMATLLQEQTSRFDAAERDLLTQAAHDLDRVSAVLAGARDRSGDNLGTVSDEGAVARVR